MVFALGGDADVRRVPRQSNRPEIVGDGEDAFALEPIALVASRDGVDAAGREIGLSTHLGGPAVGERPRGPVAREDLRGRGGHLVALRRGENFKSAPAVLIWTNLESADQSTCVIASLPASFLFAFLPKKSASGFSTASVWSTSLYAQCTSRTRNRPSWHASPEKLFAGASTAAAMGAPSGAC